MAALRRNTQDRQRCYGVVRQQHELNTNLLESQRSNGKSVLNISSVVLSIMIIGLGSPFCGTRRRAPW